MRLATFILTFASTLAFAGVRPGVAVAQTQPASTQQGAQTEAAPAPASPAAKPCSTNSAATSTAKTDCPPAAKSKKHKATAAPSAGPTRRVIRNGGASDPPLAISPSVTEQQAAQQLATTNGLLAKTDENLKVIDGRQLKAGQQDTVEQIRSYIKQSRSAADGGDVQRAYTLANKARMLSSDLVKHSGPAHP